MAEVVSLISRMLRSEHVENVTLDFKIDLIDRKVTGTISTRPVRSKRRNITSPNLSNRSSSVRRKDRSVAV